MYHLSRANFMIRAFNGQSPLLSSDEAIEYLKSSLNSQTNFLLEIGYSNEEVCDMLWKNEDKNFLKTLDVLSHMYEKINENLKEASKEEGYCKKKTI
jgi:hypothetical protein